MTAPDAPLGLSVDQWSRIDALAVSLPQLRFSVLALGDSTYEPYCEAGRRMDREAFGSALEITAATPRFLDHWAMRIEAPALRLLTHQERADERSAFLRTHQIIDIVRAFPVREPEPQGRGGRPASVAVSPLLHRFQPDAGREGASHRQDRLRRAAGFLGAWWDLLVNWDFVDDQYAAGDGKRAPWRYPAPDVR